MLLLNSFKGQTWSRSSMSSPAYYINTDFYCCCSIPPQISSDRNWRRSWRRSLLWADMNLFPSGCFRRWIGSILESFGFCWSHRRSRCAWSRWAYTWLNHMQSRCSWHLGWPYATCCSRCRTFQWCLWFLFYRIWFDLRKHRCTCCWKYRKQQNLWPRSSPQFYSRCHFECRTSHKLCRSFLRRFLQWRRWGLSQSIKL